MILQLTLPAVPTTSAPTSSPATRRWRLAGADKNLFGRRVRSVLLDRIDRVLGAGLARIALGPENDLAVIFELGDILAGLVLLDHEFMGHCVSPFVEADKLAR